METREWLEERFDTILALLFIWFIAGIFADGHNHAHGAPITFFTPEHGIFYSAFIVTLGLFGVFIYHGWRQDDKILGELPEGHRITFYGLILFFLGGFGDMIWHETLGIESTTEALYSPPHILLAVGAVIFLSGPLRRAWKDGVDTNWIRQFPMMTSAAVLLSVLSFMTMYAHPIFRPFASTWYDAVVYNTGTTLSTLAGIDIGILSIILQSAFTVGLILLLIDRFELVPGALTYIIGLSTLGMSYVAGHYVFVPGFIAAGILVDIIYTHWKPDTSKPRKYRIYSFLVPVTIYAYYFGTLMFTGGITWSIHLWTGAIFIAGITGQLISFLILPDPHNRHPK